MGRNRLVGMGFLVGVYLGSHFTLLQHLESSPSDNGEKVDGLKKSETRRDDFSSCTTARSEAVKLRPRVEDEATNPVCGWFQDTSPFGIPTASSIWGHMFNRIHQSSRLLQDTQYTQKDVTAQLLQLVSPRLPNSVKTVIRNDWDIVDTILRKGYHRYESLQKDSLQINSDKESPPVQILVMGGSVTRGVNCHANVKGVDRFQCAWPNRLEQLINQIFGGTLVKVHVVGMGGSNSATASALFEYDLLPSAAKNPDIVIHNYATNDMHVLTMQQAKDGNVTLREKVFDMTQDFVRHVWASKSCRTGPRPLFVHLDDYLGNEQNEIWTTTELAQAVTVLANYYGFPSMSYADMVRDIVYANTKETTFSPEGWYKNGKYGREIHPGATAHITMAWMSAYNLLNLATEYCSTKMFELKEIPITHNQSTRQVLFRNSSPNEIPPSLNKTLSLKDISTLWKVSTAPEKHTRNDSSECPDRCIFSWVSGMDLEQANVEYIKELFNGHIVEPSGWKVAENHQKLGFLPDSRDDNPPVMTLEFLNLSQSIQSVTIFFMKSYGEKWQGSLVEVAALSNHPVEAKWRELAKKQISGFHGKTTSETYTTEIKFGEREAVAAGRNLRITLTLIGGKTFKMMGIAVCS